MKSESDRVIELANGEIILWIDSGTLHLKCISKKGDPVELNSHEVLELLTTLKNILPGLD